MSLATVGEAVEEWHHEGPQPPGAVHKRVELAELLKVGIPSVLVQVVDKSRAVGVGIAVIGYQAAS